MCVPAPTEFRETFEHLLSFHRGPVGTLGNDVCTTLTVENDTSHIVSLGLSDSYEMNQVSSILSGTSHTSPDSSNCRAIGSLCKKYI